MGAPITASVVADSVGPSSPRLTTFLVRYPKFVHGEHCRHRSHSLCVSSSRAIPSSRYLEIVRSDDERAEPAFWGAEQKGMSPGGELDDEDRYRPENGGGFYRAKSYARGLWSQAAWMTSNIAERLVRVGVHKSIANRLLDPFVPVNVLDTSCEDGFLNWFGLRLDRAADPTIRALAEAMWVAWNESTPQLLQPGEWHLPFVDLAGVDEKHIWDAATDLRYRDGRAQSECMLDVARRVSAARCARLSYRSYETGKRSTIEEDLALYERLLLSRPIHASPAEQQATPDRRVQRVHYLNDEVGVQTSTDARQFQAWLDRYVNWERPERHGNLPGWIQARKLLPDEAVAALPPGYEYHRAWAA